MRDNLTKTRSFTYLLPKLASLVNISKDKVKNLFLGIQNTTRNFNGSVYLWTSDSTDYTKDKYYASTTNTKTGDLIEFDYPCRDTYVNFIEGKYSKIPPESKKLIINYHKNSPNITKVKKILYKHESLFKELEDKLGVEIDRYNEVGDKINFEEEIYNTE